MNNETDNALPPTYIAAAIQMNAGDRVADNLAHAEDLIAEAAARKAELAVLPEFFPLLSADETAKLTIAEAAGSGMIQDFLAAAAARHRLYLVGGTLPIIAPPDAAGRPRVFAASLLYAPDGACLARYDKIHLFQFRGRDSTVDETTTTCPGDTPVAVTTPLGRIGLSVCYDLRFPELYRAMGQPDVITAPSAFTQETGRMHWRLLLQARAVENLAHVIGASQGGEHPGGRRTHGETMIVGPQGDVLACAESDGNEVVTAVIDAAAREQWRQRLPALSNRRIFTDNC